MSDSCTVREGILVDTSPSGLNELRKTAINLIKKHLYPDAQMVNQSNAVTLHVSYPAIGEYTISPSDIIFEIEKMDLDNFLKIDTTGWKGCYNFIEGKIFLIRDNWCIETIIHETLHSCSRFSVQSELQKYLNLYEGLTEFFTGYILYKEFQDCYTNCFRTIGQACQMTYEDYIKLCSGFCNFVSLKHLIGLYFLTANSWDVEVEKFVKSVNNLGYTNFKNPFARGKLATEIKFEIQCRNAFGGSFQKICNDRKLFSNYSTIIDS